MRTRYLNPRFAAFLGAQFLGAANDNAFKLTLTAFILWRVTGEAEQVRLGGLATLLFPLPFLLFSPLAGYLSDRFSKQRMVLVTKAPEIVAMALATLAFASGSIRALLGVLFLMAAQSAFFSPPKYGLLPEAIPHRHLSMANGLLQMTTNLAILAGSVLGVVMFGAFRDELWRVGWVYTGIAVTGTLLASYVPRTPPGSRAATFEWFVGSSARRSARLVRGRPDLAQPLLGIAYFSFLGSIFLAVIPIYGNHALGLSVERSSILLLVVSVGMAAGSLAAGRLSQGRVELGLVPLGSLGLAVTSLGLVLLGGAGEGSWRLGGIPVASGGWLLSLGVSAGLFLVPLEALLQQHSAEGMKGRMIAFSNILSFSAVLLAGAIPWLLARAIDVDARMLLLGASGIALAATVYIVARLPNFLVRLVLYLTVNVLYRIEVEGDENVPRKGALLVANHVSWVDAFLVGLASDRMVRFLMYRPYYEALPLRWFFRRMRVIPIAAGDTPEKKEASLAQAQEEIRRDHVVCIFAEGAITRTGNLLKFRRGLERIAEGMDAPIVPVYLDGVWGSLLSWERGRLLFKWPRSLRTRVRVCFGAPLPPDSRADEVRAAIQEVSVAAFRLRKAAQRPLAVEFLATAKRFWRRPFIADATGAALRFGEALDRSLALAEEVRRTPGGIVGVLMPPGVPGAIANLAVLCAGRAVSNLDGSAGPAALRREIEVAGVSTILTAGRFVDESRLGAALDGMQRIEVGGGADGSLRRLPPGRRLLLRMLPGGAAVRRFLPEAGGDVDRPAAILFSASAPLHGRTAAAVLTHHNILSNMESLKQVFRLSRADRILGVLPLDSSFGLFGTVLLPAAVGVAVAFQADPTDTRSLAAMGRRHSLSILPIPTGLLRSILEEVPAADLPALRQVIVAGAPLAEDLSARFAEKFGVEPLEGFGCAECAPLVSLNVPPQVDDARGQTAKRTGTQGQPLPGVAVRVVDPATGRVRRPGEAGRLEVSGPNVMLGYHHDPAATAAALVDGWYRTGRAATVDEDGFLTLLDDA